MPTIADITSTAETPDRYRQIDAAIALPVDPDSAADVTCFLSTDSVDDDNEVMLPGGCDLGRFGKNGPLMLVHDYTGNYYPLPVGQVLWVQKRPRGLLGGLKFARGTEMGREVKAIVEERILRGVSVGFRVIEKSAMTRQEAASRADWQEAYTRTGGKITVIRKWKLLELSLTPIPCNEDALIQTLSTKGLKRPSWLKPPETKAVSANSETTPGPDAPETKAVGDADERGNTTVGEYDADTLEPIGGPPPPDLKAHAEPDAEPDDDGDDDEEGPPIRQGHFVKVTGGNRDHRGAVGKVKSVHRGGMVPDVEDDVKATKAEPGVRVNCYKAMGEGHVETGAHIGCKMADCERIDDLRPPKKRKSADPDPSALPPISGKTDAEVQAERMAAVAAALTPAAVEAFVRKQVEKRQGAV